MAGVREGRGKRVEVWVETCCMEGSDRCNGDGARGCIERLGKLNVAYTRAPFALPLFAPHVESRTCAAIGLLPGLFRLVSEERARKTDDRFVWLLYAMLCNALSERFRTRWQD